METDFKPVEKTESSNEGSCEERGIEIVRSWDDISYFRQCLGESCADGSKKEQSNYHS